MSTLFSIESKDITDLDALQLTKLLKLLLHLEARTFGIADRAVDVALNINVPDGGEDGRIQWNNGPSETNYLPCRLVQFQNKAKNMGPVDCAKEIINKDGSMKRKVEEVLDNDGAYIIFTTKQLNKDQKDERIKAIRDKLSTLDKPYVATAIIDIYDASKIEGWVNKYIPAIVSVQNWARRSIIPGLKTWNEWGDSKAFQLFLFIADESRQKALDGLKALLNKPQKCARILGLSGLGKTRLAFEVFRDVNEHDDLSERVVYFDASDNSSIHHHVSDWVRFGLEGIIVIDNCNVSLHDVLRQEVQRTDSKLSLLTLDNNFDHSSQTDIFIKLKKMPDEKVKQMLEPVYGKKITDIDRIVQFAQGFPQMAVLLADARLDRDPEMGSLTDDNLLNKMLWGDKEPDENDKKILKGCALFNRFGLDNEAYIEYEFIAKNIVRIDFCEFYQCVKKFEERGIIDRRGRFAQLVPKPLAIRLASKWWSRTRPEERMELIQSEMPGTLVESFCDQISYLDFLPEVKTLTEELCGSQGPFGQAEVILSERGSMLFRSFVEVNPEVTSKALSNVLNSLSEKELFAIGGDVRRNLVWALEKLCFHETYFEESVNSLLLLASAENESWSNNATGQFKQLFRTFLSGTEAPPSLRMKVIDSALGSDRNSIRKIAVETLDQIIETYGGFRTIGAEYQGSGAPLEEWRPKVWGEAFEYWEQALERLCGLVLKGDILAIDAKASIGRHIRGLLQYGRIVVLDTVIRKIVESEGPLWPEALNSIKDILSYDSDKMPAEGIETLKKWIGLLTPDDLVDRLKLYITNPPYEHEKDENGHYIDIAAKNAKLLSVELASDIELVVPYLDNLLTGEQRQAYWFATNLVQSNCVWEPLLSEVINKVITIEKPNINFLIGILNGVFHCDSLKWEDIVKRFSENEALFPYYAEAINSGNATREQLNSLVKLIDEKKIEPSSANTFVYGRSFEHLSSEIVCHFVQQLTSVSDSAARIALDILSMYCYQKHEKWELCITTFKEIVVNISLNCDNKQSQFDMYHWKDVVEKLLNLENEEFAIVLTKKITESCSEEIDYSDLRFYLKPVIRKIFQQYGVKVWPFFAEAIKNADPRTKSRFIQLLQSEDMFDNMKDSVLGDLPYDLLREWCFQEPDIAPKFLAQVTNVLKEVDDKYRMSPMAQFLIDNFGDNDRVLSYLSANLGSVGWSDSAVPYFQKELVAFESLKNHKKANVRAWADRRIDYLSKMIKIEERRDEEHDWGIY